jgi:replicative DNA helicase
MTTDLKQTKRQRPVPEPSLERLPPSAPDMERGVLGCILLDPKCYLDAKERIVSQDSFYCLPHQIIWDSLDEKTDFIILQQRLKDKGLLDQVGGIPYLSQLQDAVPSAANLSYYLDIIHEKYLLRKMLSVCTEIAGRVYDYEGEPEKLLDEVERDILKINEHRQSTSTGIIGDCIQRVQEKIEYYHANRGKITGITTGFPKLDVLTAGLKGGEAIIVAARPGAGKTALAMNIVERAAIELQLPVGVFSLEMDKDALTFRMLCGRAGVDSKKAQRGDLTPDEFKSITDAARKVRKAPIFVDDTPGLTINALRARGRRLWQKYAVRLIVIDYLQLMSCPKKKGDYNRQQEIGEISAGVKSLARECNIPIILLSQLNREIEKEKGRKPRLSDLRESGNIEQDADLVLMLYSPKAKKDEDEEGEHDLDHVPINLLIAKQRNGPSDRIVPLTFHKIFTRFEERKRQPTKVEPEDSHYYQPD